MANKLNKYSYNAIVLKYSIVNCIYPLPLNELDETLKYIEMNYQSINNVVLMGFSAGGHLIANFVSNFKRCSSIKISAQIFCYPLLDLCDCHHIGNAKVDLLFSKTIKAITGKDVPDRETLKMLSPNYNIHEKIPATFIWHTVADSLIDCDKSLEYCKQLIKYNIPFECHIFEMDEHGISIYGDNTAIWFDLFIAFMENKV